MSFTINATVGNKTLTGTIDLGSKPNSNATKSDPTAQQNAVNILNQQKSGTQTDAPQIEVRSDEATLQKVAKSYANPSLNYGKSLDELQSALSAHPKLKSEAEALCTMLKAQLNTSLTAGSAEERTSALEQFKGNIDYLSQQGIDPKVLDELRAVGDTINSQSLDPKTSEDVLLGMLHVVISNSRDSMLADDFVNMYREQRDFARDAKPEAKVQAERQLQSSVEIMKQHGVSQEFLNEMVHVEKKADVTTPSVDVPKTPEVKLEPTQNQILTQQLMEKFPGSNEEDVQTLVTILSDSPNAVTVLKKLTPEDFNALMTAFKNGYQSNSEDATKLAAMLIDKLMPYPQLHDVVGNAFGQIPKEGDTELLTNLQAMHKKSVACSILVNALPEGHELRDKALSEIKHTDILDLIKSENNSVKKSLADLDILLCNTYFLLGEGKTDIAALPEDWLNKVLDIDFVELGVTGSDQLKQADRILHGGLLTKSARKSMINMLRESSTDGSQRAEARLQALATHLLGLKSMGALSTENLLFHCAKEYGLMVNDTGINAAIQALSEQAQVDTLQTTFAQMQNAQGDDKPLARKDVKGETLGYTVLTLQRALVQDASELSEFDLASLGATPEDVKDAESLKNFVENVWINTGKTDWATGILLASYVATGESLENISSQKAITETQKTAAEKAKPSTAERHDIIESLNIVDTSLLVDTSLNIQLGEGRTEFRLSSDKTGAILKELCQRYRGITDAKESKKLTLGNKPVTIGGKAFNLASDNPEELRQAIVAILNHKPMIIEGKEETYLDPVNVAHSILAYKHHATEMQDKMQQATQRVEHVHGKAIKGRTDNPRTKAIMAAITADLSQTIGLIDKQQSIIGKALEDFMAPLLKNPKFQAYILPLALLSAQKNLGMNSANELIAQAKDVTKRDQVKNALSKAFQDMGVSKANAGTLAEGVLHIKLDQNQTTAALMTLAEKALDVYVMGRNTVNMFGQSSEVKSFLQKEAVRANTLKILNALDNKHALEFSHTLEAGIDVPIAGPVSANIKAGKQDGIALWRDENGKPCISISQAVMAQAGLSASLGIDQASLEASAEVHGSVGEGLVLEFEDNEKCADFMGALMSNTANREDLRLCSKVQLGTSMTIGGSVSASATLSTEASSERLGVCTVSIGASASIAGDIQFERTKSGNSLTTTSTSTINAQASVGASVSHATSNDDGGISSEASHELSVSHHVEQKVEVETNLKGTSLLGAKSSQTTFIEADTVDNALQEVQDICKRNGIAQNIQEGILQYIKDNNLTSLDISLEHTLKGDINTIMQDSTTVLNTPETINAFVNNRENYEMSAIAIRSLEQAMGDEISVGIITSRNEAKKSITQTFTLKS